MRQKRTSGGTSEEVWKIEVAAARVEEGFRSLKYALFGVYGVSQFIRLYKTCQRPGRFRVY